METQTECIRKYLQAGYTLTAIGALNLFRCFRLAARIADLRAVGYQIETEMIETDGGKRVAQYRMKAVKQPELF